MDELPVVGAVWRLGEQTISELEEEIIRRVASVPTLTRAQQAALLGLSTRGYFNRLERYGLSYTRQPRPSRKEN